MREGREMDDIIKEFKFKPNAFYAVYSRHLKDFSDTLERLARDRKIDVRGCSFIYLHPDERVEEFSDERLAELGLRRVRADESKEV